MLEWISALRDPDLPFLRLALAAGLLSSIAFGILGPIVVAKRIGTIAGSISHSVLGGVGLALFLQHAMGWYWFSPTFGALAAAFLSAVVIWLVSQYGREREDTAIVAVWTVGMATGVLFLSLTRGFVDPMSYLFGNILLITPGDILSIAVLDLLVVAFALLFHRSLLAVCFDEEFAGIRGLHTGALTLLMLVLIAATVVVFLPLVGTVLVIAMLTLPAAIAGLFSRHLWSMMVWSGVIGAVFTVLGVAVSFAGDLPTGATVVVLLGAVYLVLVVGRRIWRR
jgi:zinc transport system permease protein